MHIELYIQIENWQARREMHNKNTVFYKQNKHIYNQ